MLDVSGTLTSLAETFNPRQLRISVVIEVSQIPLKSIEEVQHDSIPVSNTRLCHPPIDLTKYMPLIRSHLSERTGFDLPECRLDVG